MEHFEDLSAVNDLVEQGREGDAREQLILLLDKLKRSGGQYSPLINHLIREVGLFPYLKEESASWQDRFAVNAFKVDVGEEDPRPLHREQSALLSKLLDGESVAVSAPTSFGKSFVIDAFISIAKPNVVLIIVPTIALMDEARRRLQRKFSDEYRIVTTTDAGDVETKVIFVFPQERAISYAGRIRRLDLLVVDEFYKASATFDKVRSPALVRAILRFSNIAKQRYFLAPNIHGLKDNPLTKGMSFLRLDFNTVVLKKYDLSKAIAADKGRKEGALKDILCGKSKKTLIYAGSYQQVAKVGEVVEGIFTESDSELIQSFAEWLEENYERNWNLPRLVRMRVGLHNGQLHRSLSQIQVRLFEESEGLQVVISTSSIIEGVNTSAERVIIWNNKNGVSKLTDFDYRNIVGRSGRMFKHFVGEVYILEAPPVPQEQQLELALPDSLLGLEEMDPFLLELSDGQREKAERYEAEMDSLFDFQVVRELQSSGRLQTGDNQLIRKMVAELKANPVPWKALSFLNSDDVAKWDFILYRAINLDTAGWDAPFGHIVASVKSMADGWSISIPEQMKRLSPLGIRIEDYLKLERDVSYKLSTLLGDLNSLHGKIYPDRGFDISRFVFQLSHAFLPPAVYQLEEIGLPRMMSRKIHQAGFIDFCKEGVNLQLAVKAILSNAEIIGAELFVSAFERYAFRYFFEGVVSARSTSLAEISSGG